MPIVGVFDIQASITNGESEIASASQGETVIHTVTVENISVLPYDVEVDTVLPANSSGSLVFLNGTDDYSWTADLWIDSGKKESSNKQIKVIKAGPAKERVHSTRARWTKNGLPNGTPINRPLIKTLDIK